MRRAVLAALIGVLMSVPSAAKDASGKAEPASKSVSAAPPSMPRREPVLDQWHSEIARDHPLVGMVWSAVNKKLVGVAVLQASLGAADFVLLGEVHDNPDHHRLQAFAIRTIAVRRKLPVVMEMLSADQSDGLAQFYSGGEGASGAMNPDRLFDKVDWDKSGWPARDVYRPLVAEIIASGMQIHIGSDGRKSVRAIGRVGFDDLSVGRLKRLGLDAALSEDLLLALKRELISSHCGLVGKNAILAMATVQRYRDGYMAAALVRQGKKEGAVLIAGNGHVRKDRGVPWYLDRIASDRTSVVVMVVEVEQDENDPGSYMPKSPDGEAVADYLVFTPRARRADPCEQMRKIMEQGK
ncbi:MAG: hypothetical protein RLZ98_3780 [Pseudomonadota bacterium]|jgi:uncharacterized iron-regulated protein